MKEPDLNNASLIETNGLPIEPKVKEFPVIPLNIVCTQKCPISLKGSKTDNFKTNLEIRKFY